MLKRAVFFVLIGCCLTLGVQAATLHVIIAANTNDETIGTGAAVNVQIMTAFAQQVAQRTGLELKLKVFQGDEHRPDYIYDCLNDLHPQYDDVLLYYHNTHGFRTKNMNEPWPALCFENSYVRLQEIIDMLKQKQQRLTLVFTEACNNLIDVHSPLDHKMDLTPLWFWYKNNYSRLFKTAAGIIVASSSEPKQYSWISPTTGGIYTNSLLEAFNDGVRSSNSSWDSIMQKAAENTCRYVSRYRAWGGEIDDQYPIHQIRLLD